MHSLHPAINEIIVPDGDVSLKSIQEGYFDILFLINETISITLNENLPIA